MENSDIKLDDIKPIENIIEKSIENPIELASDTPIKKQKKLSEKMIIGNRVRAKLYYEKNVDKVKDKYKVKYEQTKQENSSRKRIIHNKNIEEVLLKTKNL